MFVALLRCALHFFAVVDETIRSSLCVLPIVHTEFKRFVAMTESTNNEMTQKSTQRANISNETMCEYFHQCCIYRILCNPKSMCMQFMSVHLAGRRNVDLLWHFFLMCALAVIFVVLVSHKQKANINSLATQSSTSSQIVLVTYSFLSFCLYMHYIARTYLALYSVDNDEWLTILYSNIKFTVVRNHGRWNILNYQTKEVPRWRKNRRTVLFLA